MITEEKLGKMTTFCRNNTPLRKENKVFQTAQTMNNISRSNTKW